jgi:choice-of-anchor C domain-containing protein
MRWLLVPASFAFMAVAQANLVSNGSFELGSPQPNPFRTLGVGNTYMIDWTVMSGNVDWVKAPQFDASLGSNSVDLNGNTSTPRGSISQTISSGLVAGELYVVTFDMSGNPDGSLVTDPVRNLELSVGGVSQSFAFDTSAVGGGISATNMGYITQSFIFNAPGTGTTLTFLSQDSTIYSAVIDNVTLELVPEPSAMMLLGFGALGIVSRRRARAV